MPCCLLLHRPVMKQVHVAEAKSCQGPISPRSMSISRCPSLSTFLTFKLDGAILNVDSQAGSIVYMTQPFQRHNMKQP